VQGRAGTVTLGAETDIVGEVAYPAAYAPRDLMEAISDTETRGAKDAYSARSDPSPTSPTISETVTPYTIAILYSSLCIACH